MLTMQEDAIIKAMRREIPFEEINTLGGDVISGNEEDAISKSGENVSLSEMLEGKNGEEQEIHPAPEKGNSEVDESK